jgi:hypothetical protein
MIISASRRTDIPAFYAQWFINRIRSGYCTVPNPFNPRQVSRLSLLPEDVDVIVFWTRNPRPLFTYLDELDQRGYRYYFQFTLLGYPAQIDPHSPPHAAAIATFRELAARIGSQRIIWRYDPLVFSKLTGAQYHAENYAQLAAALKDATRRSVVSLVDLYAKIRKRIAQLNQDGLEISEYPGAPSQSFDELMNALVQAAQQNDMTIQSCAEQVDLTVYGIHPGKCIDDQYIAATFGLQVDHRKDPGQRKACGCVVSKDIGMYDSCLFGCPYCYATASFERARHNHAQHDPASPSLLGWYD